MQNGEARKEIEPLVVIERDAPRIPNDRAEDAVREPGRGQMIWEMVVEVIVAFFPHVSAASGDVQSVQYTDIDSAAH